MVELKKDRQGETWIVTTTDSEGYHRQINLTRADFDELVRMWNKQNTLYLWDQEAEITR